MKTQLLTAALAGVIATGGVAQATVAGPNECRVTSTGWPWYSGPTQIDVYLSSTSPAWTAMGFTQPDFIKLLDRGLAAMNEQLGTAVYLHYAGSTTDAWLNNAVIIRGDAGCSTSPPGALGQTFYRFRAPTGVLQWGGSGITMYGSVDKGDGHGCQPTAWGFTEDASTFDPIQVLTHELLHAAFDIDHPDHAANSSCNPPANVLSIMGAGYVQRPARNRTMKEWDMEVAQARAGQRGQWSTLTGNSFTAPSTWSLASAPSPQALNLVYGPGSMSLGGRDPVNGNFQIFGWSGNSSTTEGIGGSGVPKSSSLYGGTFHSTQTLDGTTTPLPAFPIVGLQKIAVTAKPGTAELLLAYEEYTSPTQAHYIAGSDVKRVCYRRSTNAGVTWGTPLCPTSSTADAEKTGRYGLSATYDPTSDAFLIGYANDTDFGASPVVGGVARMTVLVEPAIGSATPEKFTILGGGAGLGYNAPGLACGGSTVGCRIAFGDLLGCLNWFEATVSATTGAVSVPVTRTQCITTVFDTPSLIWNPTLNEFVMVNTVENSRLDSFTMSGTGTAWSSAGFALAAGHFVSTAVLSMVWNSTGYTTSLWWAQFL